MKLFVMPKEPTWWVWLITVAFLVVGLAGIRAGFEAALALSVVQSGWFLWKHRRWTPYPVQIRVAYTAMLATFLVSGWTLFFWVPTIGTSAVLLFGYCLMARLLSLMPWNRHEAMTADLLRRTFFTAPILGRADHGLPAVAGRIRNGCEDEGNIARR